MTAVLHSAGEYASAFARAQGVAYPEVDAFEQRMGVVIETERLEAAARVLACPVKHHDAHWQHGRVIYAATRNYLKGAESARVHLVDIGTAKGFSALCLLWALRDEPGAEGDVQSVDVISPSSMEARNTVAEVDGLKTLYQTLAPWPEASAIGFAQSTGIDFLKGSGHRIHVAFVDGKHTGDVVRQEGKLLAHRQESGDLAIFDDCQIPAVSQAVVSLEQWYRIEYVTAGPRDYGIARRR